MKYKTVIVLAIAAAHAELHGLDALAAGGYIVSFDATHVAPKNFANAALDVFHRNVPLKELDSFEFYVLDPRENYKVVGQGDAPAYAYAGEGDVDGPHLADWKVAAFRVMGKGATAREGCELGCVTMGGVDLKEMADNAVGLLWDERLRASGLSPYVERAHDEELAAVAEQQRPA